MNKPNQQTKNWVDRQREVQRACKAILNGDWQFVNNTIVDLPTHYAVQQYKDNRQLIHTVTMSREGIVLTIQ